MNKLIAMLLLPLASCDEKVKTPQDRHMSSGNGIVDTSSVVPLLVLKGESGPGGQGYISALTKAELAVRPHVQILNNHTFLFEPLQIGVNNTIDHFGIDGTKFHGMENGLAHTVEEGLWNNRVIYMLKGTQGGATIAQFGEGSLYAYKFSQRVNAAKKELDDMGKTPDPYIIYQIGINDKDKGTDTATFRRAVIADIKRTRECIGRDAPVIIPGFPDPSGMAAFEKVFDKVSRQLPGIYRIDVTGLPTNPNGDIYHLSSAGQDSLGKMVAKQIISIIQQRAKL